MMFLVGLFAMLACLVGLLVCLFGCLVGRFVGCLLKNGDTYCSQANGIMHFEKNQKLESD